MAILLTTPIGKPGKEFTHAFVQDFVLKEREGEDDRLFLLIGLYRELGGIKEFVAVPHRYGLSESSPSWSTYKDLYDTAPTKLPSQIQEDFEQQLITDGIYPGTLV